jgi:hypothetical protein
MYWKTEIGLDPKFQTLVNIWVSFSLILYTYLAYIGNLSYTQQLTANEVNNYSSYFNDLYNNTITFFMNNIEINYYYNELFNGIPNNNNKRNLQLESQISFIMLSKIENIINCIKSYDYFKQTDNNTVNNDLIYNKLITILTQFFKSSIFIENWYIYKTTFADNLTIKFIKTNFNL